MRADPHETMLAESELAALRERFRNACRDFLAPPMAEALRRDFTTFPVRIDRAPAPCRGAGDCTECGARRNG